MSLIQANDVILIAGDSVTADGSDPSSPWITHFQVNCNATIPNGNVTVINGGEHGDYSSTLLARMPALLAQAPTILVVFIGINDANQQPTGADPTNPGTQPGDQPNMIECYEANMKGIINLGLACASVRQIILLTPLCNGEKWDGGNPQDQLIEAISECLRMLTEFYASTGKVNLIELRNIWNIYENRNNPKDVSSGILTSDGVHPNAAGATFMCNVLSEYLGLTMVGGW